MEENIKGAFNKVKEDIEFLNGELLDIKTTMNDLHDIMKTLTNKLENQEKQASTDRQTLRQLNSTQNTTSTHNSTVPQEVEGLKPLNLPISIGNQGVSTDRQTDNQTDNSTHIPLVNTSKTIDSNIREATEILDSLDSLKKEIRLKFKHLTTQEMLVFSTIYQLEEQGNREITYKLLSKSLKLSESSIRDYVQRMINKGVSIQKEKVNNKKLLLTISPNLKKIASLPTIIQLREL
jgi:uncharacterized coiled-coil protein SlyX